LFQTNDAKGYLIIPKGPREKITNIVKENPDMNLLSIKDNEIINKYDRCIIELLNWHINFVNEENMKDKRHCNKILNYELVSNVLIAGNPTIDYPSNIDKEATARSRGWKKCSADLKIDEIFQQIIISINEIIKEYEKKISERNCQKIGDLLKKIDEYEYTLKDTAKINDVSDNYTDFNNNKEIGLYYTNCDKISGVPRLNQIKTLEKCDDIKNLIKNEKEMYKFSEYLTDNLSNGRYNKQYDDSEIMGYYNKCSLIKKIIPKIKYFNKIINEERAKSVKEMSCSRIEYAQSGILDINQDLDLLSDDQLDNYNYKCNLIKNIIPKIKHFNNIIKEERAKSVSEMSCNRIKNAQDQIFEINKNLDLLSDDQRDNYNYKNCEIDRQKDELQKWVKFLDEETKKPLNEINCVHIKSIKNKINDIIKNYKGDLSPYYNKEVLEKFNFLTCELHQKLHKNIDMFSEAQNCKDIKDIINNIEQIINDNRGSGNIKELSSIYENKKDAFYNRHSECIIKKKVDMIDTAMTQGSTDCKKFKSHMNTIEEIKKDKPNINVGTYNELKTQTYYNNKCIN